MSSRSQLASLALFVLAAVHAWWGARLLLASELLLAASQLVGVGGFVLAAVAAGHRSRSALAVGLGVAAGAAALRLLVGLADPGPFTGATGALVGGLALAAWGVWRIEARHDAPGAVALRAGGLLMAAAYFSFLALGIALAGAASASSIVDFVARALASVAFAFALEAPAVLGQRKAFGGEPASAAR